MPDGLIEGYVAASPVFSAITLPLALLAFLVEFVRGRSETRSFRPVVGWAAAVLGFVAAVSAVTALRAKDVSPLDEDGRLLSFTALVSLLLIVVGAGAAILTPSADRSVVQEVASSTEAAVRASEDEDHFARSQYVSLGLTVSTNLAWSGSQETSNVRGLRMARIPTATVSVLAGPTGSGKSVELRHHVLSMCRKAKRSRRPRHVAVYVSLRGLDPLAGQIDQDTITRQLTEAVGKGNASLGQRFGRFLAGDARGPRWLFAFDLGGELTRDQEEQYFQALRNFMRHRDHDRALVVVRDAFPDAQPVFALCEPTPGQSRELLRGRGITETPDRAIRANPAMITQFTGTSRQSLPEVLDAYIAARLTRHSAVNQSSESLRHKAEAVAYDLTMGLPLPESDLDPLLGPLGRIEGGGFAFRFPLVRTHLAAAHLVRTRPVVPLSELVRTAATRDMLVAALQRGDGEFRRSTTRLVLAAIEPVQDIESTALPPLGTFSWPPVILHALTVLRDAAAVPDEPRLTSAIDHLVWQGVFGGAKRDREAALSLLPLASPRRVLELYRQAVSLRYDTRTTTSIADHLKWDPNSPDHLDLTERVVVVARALEAWWSGKFVPRADSANLAGLLALLVRGGTTIAMVTLGGLTIRLVAQLPSAISWVEIVLIFVLLAGWSYAIWRLYKGTGNPEDTISVILLCLGVPLIVVAGLLLNLAAVLIALFTWDLPGLPGSLFLLWAYSWPLAMAVHVVHAPHGQRHWLFPQRHLGELFAYREELAHYIGLAAKRLDHLRSSWRLAVIAILCAVLAVLPVDLPIRGDLERYIDFPLLGLVIIVAVLVLKRPMRRADADAIEVMGRLTFSGALTGDRLLGELAERAEGGLPEISRLLTTLAAAPAGSLRQSVEMLDSLDVLLEFIKRTLPADFTSAISRGLWQYMPQSCSPDLLRWAIPFDRRHTGRLVKLAYADADRTRLTHAIDSAKAQLPAGTG